jgi:hypothetical protein
MSTAGEGCRSAFMTWWFITNKRTEQPSPLIAGAYRAAYGLAYSKGFNDGEDSDGGLGFGPR